MLLDSVRTALASRSQTLLPSLHAEGTDCYRLFHGATEGEPGCTLERFGDLLDYDGQILELMLGATF